MANERDGEPVARAPTRQDLVRIATALNAHGVRYAVIGGIAMLHYGFARATMDIDLLVDPAPDNIDRARMALAVLEDRASLDVQPDDVRRYSVVRIADEVVVDLLGSACGVSFADVEPDLVMAEVDGVSIPYASPEQLTATKRSVRSKDATDRAFLEALIRAREED